MQKAYLILLQIHFVKQGLLSNHLRNCLQLCEGKSDAGIITGFVCISLLYDLTAWFSIWVSFIKQYVHHLENGFCLFEGKVMKIRSPNLEELPYYYKKFKNNFKKKTRRIELPYYIKRLLEIHFGPIQKKNISTILK